MKKLYFNTVINETEDVSAIVVVYPAEPDVNIPRPYVNEVSLRDADGNEVDLGQVSEEDMNAIQDLALNKVGVV